MSEFSKVRRVVISEGHGTAAKDYVCDLCGYPIMEGEQHYTAGVVDRYEGRKERLHICDNCSGFFMCQDGPPWIQQYFYDNRYVEDEPNI